MIKNIGHLKNNIVGGVFDRFFDDLNKGQAGEPFKFDLRNDTSIFIFPNKERVTIVFSLTFNEKVDLEVARVFLQVIYSFSRCILIASALLVLCCVLRFLHEDNDNHLIIANNNNNKILLTDLS